MVLHVGRIPVSPSLDRFHQGRLRLTRSWSMSRVVIMLLWACLGSWGCSGSDTPDDQTQPSEPPPTTKSSGSASAIPVKNEKSSICRLYTEPAGFWVMVDSVPVRDDQGELLKTPCALTLTDGLHEIMAMRPGYRDESTSLTVPRDSEVELQPTMDPDGTSESVLNADFFEAEVGEPIPLLSLHSPSSELDPFLSPDGLQLWFVGHREQGKGIYVTSRATPFHAFGEPEFILASRGRDLPASPSTTRDGLSLVYLIPEDAKIWMLTRPNPLTEFGDKIALKYSDEDVSQWQSSQITADGLRLYWVEDNSGTQRTLASVRKSPDAKFGRNLRFTLPGRTPCLSDDGLRQYLFDGKILKRARRPNLLSEFSEPQVVASLNTNNYVISDRRQFCVSDDEQWLVYSDNPRRNANLYIVRVFDQPAWGFIVQGKSIPPKPKPVEVVTKPEPQNDPAGPSQPATPVDPRTLPTAYDGFRQAFLADLAAREFSQAQTLLKQTQNKLKSASDREMLNWDRADLERMLQFWSELQAALKQMQPGDPIRFGPVKLQFISFADGVITAGRGGKRTSKALSDLPASNLIALMESVQPAKQEADHLRSATFLYFDGGGNKRSAKTRFARAGEAGSQFYEQQAQRLLHLARSEFDRDNLAQGMVLLDEIERQFANTDVASQAVTARQDLYRLTQWEPSGPRQWTIDKEQGTYVAEPGAAPNSRLMSPKPYENFQLELEWKTEGRAGQGGVFFRYAGQGRPADTAFKLQLAGDFGIAADKYSTGSLFKVEAPSANAVKPTGQWNTLLLKVQGDRVQVTLNSQKVLDTRAVDSDIPLKGFVVLDGETGGISYRKTLLIDLPAEPAP